MGVGFVVGGARSVSLGQGGSGWGQGGGLLGQCGGSGPQWGAVGDQSEPALLARPFILILPAKGLSERANRPV